MKIVAYRINGQTVGIDIPTWDSGVLSGNTAFIAIQDYSSIPNGYVDISSVNNWDGFGSYTTLSAAQIKTEIIKLIVSSPTPDDYLILEGYATVGLNSISIVGSSAVLGSVISGTSAFSGVTNTGITVETFNAYTGTTSTAIGLKANTASPTFTGVVRSVTPAVNDSSTCIATTAYYIGQRATASPVMDGTAIVGTSCLFARQDHVHPVDTSRLAVSTFNTYSGATATAIGLKAPITSPTFTVSACAPNPAANNNSTCIATTAWYFGQCATGTPSMDGVAAVGTSPTWAHGDHVHPSNTAKANLAGGAAFSGIITVPKPVANDNTTCVATTSWYVSQAGTASPLMNSTVAVGTSLLFSRQDHVHPVDTSRVAKAGDTMTGALVINSNLTATGIAIFRGTTCLAAPATGSISTDRNLMYNPTSCAITAVQLCNGSDDYYYDYCSTNRTTTSTSCQLAHGYCPTTFKGGTYQVDIGSQYGNASSNACTTVLFKIDGTDFGDCYRTRNQVPSWVTQASMTIDTALSAGTHCFEVWYWNNGGTACIPRSTIRVKRIG